MQTMIGKWQQPEGQPLAGLWFDFKPDGSFTAGYPAMGIDSAGTYHAEGGLIDIDQTSHTLGVTGKFTGIYKIDGDTLTLVLGDPGAARPEAFEGANLRIYQRVA